MPLTDAQKAEADSFGISYDLYEKLQTATFDEKALAAAVASFTAPGGIGTPEGQAASIAGIAESMAQNTGLPGGIPLQFQALQLGDTVMPSYTTITYADKPPVIIDSKNPFNLPTTQEGLNNLLKGAVSITDDRVGDIPVPVIRDTPLNIPQNTIYTVFVNLSGANYSAAFINNGQTTKLKQGLNEIKVNIGSTLSFASANTSLYNLIAVDIDTGKTKKNLKASKSTPSLLADITVDTTYNVDLYTEANLIKKIRQNDII